MIALSLDDVTKTYRPGQPPAVSGLTLTLERGEILALLGPSGCGKTTTLRLIAGFERPDTGVVRLNDRLVAGPGVFVPAERRAVGMVFQDHALFPHLTVAQNVAFGLKGRPKAAVRDAVGHMLGLVGLGGLAGRYPHELSGGERQRVALARALAPQPVIVLLDEPFSNLDADLRTQVREEVHSILRSLDATAVFVTHDQEEALFMGDRLAVFSEGHLEQSGRPEDVFYFPATPFVAEFMGDADLLPGVTGPDGILTELGLVPGGGHLPAGTRGQVAFRADDIDFSPAQTGLDKQAAVVTARHFKGIYNLYRLELPSGRSVHSMQPRSRRVDTGTAVDVSIDPSSRLPYFTAGPAKNPATEGTRPTTTRT